MAADAGHMMEEGIPLHVVAKLLSVTVHDVRFIRNVLGLEANDEIVRPGELMHVLLFETFRKTGFDTNDIVAILITYKKELYNCGFAFFKNVPEDAPAMVLQVVDWRYVILGQNPNARAFDIKEQVWREGLPLPVLSLAIGLPALYGRALSAAQAR
jgi:hypothetical protein